MNIKILGTKKCKQLEANVSDYLKDNNIESSIEHVTDVKAILAFGVMRTPALVVNEKVVSVGKVLKNKDIEKLL